MSSLPPSYHRRPTTPPPPYQRLPAAPLHDSSAESALGSYAAARYLSSSDAAVSDDGPSAAAPGHSSTRAVPESDSTLEPDPAIEAPRATLGLREGYVEKRPQAGPAEARPRAQGAPVPSQRLQLAKKRLLSASGQGAAIGSPRPSTSAMFKKAYSTDLLFLIDTTSSMTNYLRAAKEQIMSIVTSINKAFFNVAEVRIAVVSYKDHDDGPRHISLLDFTPSVHRVSAFLSGLSAWGGGDPPEDVLGGIAKALSASWELKTRCIIHIADAPPHGNIFSEGNGVEDDYFEPGSEPHGLTYEPLLQQMVALEINYTLLRIKDTTDYMAFKFLQCYSRESENCKLAESNKYFKQASELCSRHAASVSRTANQAGLLFMELELGMVYSVLKALIVQSVSSSASMTAARMAAAQLQGAEGLDPSLVKKVADEDRLDTAVQQWSDLEWFEETLTMEGFAPALATYDETTLDAMMADDQNIPLCYIELTVHKRRRPFARGGLREAFCARTAASTTRYVAKALRWGSEPLAYFVEDMQCQMLSEAFALEFNDRVGSTDWIHFAPTISLTERSAHLSDGEENDDGCRRMSLEPFFEGRYVKYNSNRGYVNAAAHGINAAAQAFSHFTFERSQGRFLVSDLQGVGRAVTDPAVHTRDPGRFARAAANQGDSGFYFFFATHTCNDLCHQLRLRSTGTMLGSDAQTFNNMPWPCFVPRTYCANRLCGRTRQHGAIVRESWYAGRVWCDACMLQLKSPEANRFFRESQGWSVSPPTEEDEARGEVKIGKAKIAGEEQQEKDGAV